MALPQYLYDNKEIIIKLPPQQIALWTQSYDKYRDRDAVKSLYLEFSSRNMQRKDVIRIFKEDHYRGFVAAMMWGGINATRPDKSGGPPPFAKLLNHPKEKVVSAIEYAAKRIELGDIQELFQAFEETGMHKLPGVGHAYFTKLFFFLGELKDSIPFKPLIFDKWTANAHCALLIQLLPPGRRDQLPYKSLSLEEKYMVNVPGGKKRSELYTRYLNDMKAWAEELEVPITKLEEFIFGENLKNNKRVDNPRLALWKIITDHCGGTGNLQDNDDVKEGKGIEAASKRRAMNHKPRKAIESVSESPKGRKYFPLQEYFRKHKIAGKQEVRLTVEQIETIIGSVLPPWAFT